MEIQLSKYQFHPEDTIEGTIFLELKKTVKAKGLFVSLSVLAPQTDFYGRRRLKVTKEIYQHTQQIDGEKEYPMGTSEYSFKFDRTIPTWGGTANAKWNFGAWLDVSDFDVNKVVELVVS